MYQRRHFHTFDALRFFAFLIVFISHIPLPKLWGLDQYHIVGSVGVSFFFVLSGFLITYILLVEKLNTNTIGFKRFFGRRALRIWPLFYAMIAFAFLTPYLLGWIGLNSNDEGYQPNWLLSCLFLENYNMMLSHDFPNVSPLRVMWSLCIEEHFYIIWVFLLKFISVKRIPLLIIVSLVIANITRLIYWNIGIDSMDVFSNIDYFALGALPAYYLLQAPERLKKLDHISIPIKWISVIGIGLSVFVLPEWFKPYESLIIPTIYGPLFLIVLLFTLTNRNTFHIKDKRIVSKLGIYTYALYLLHTICINLVLKISGNLGFNPLDIKGYIIVFGVSLVLSVLVSYASYELFEKQFLKLKKRL